MRGAEKMRLPQDRILHIDTELKDGKVNIVAEWQGELVRCKDCRHANRSMLCSVYLQPRLPSDFCNYGERSEPSK